MISAVHSTAQELYDFKILESKDTLVITKQEKNFSFAAGLAYSGEKNSNGIMLPLYPNEIYSIDNPLREFDASYGYGLELSISAEYKLNDYVAAGLRVSPLSYHSSEYSLDPVYKINNMHNSIIPIICNLSHYSDFQFQN